MGTEQGGEIQVEERKIGFTKEIAFNVTLERMRKLEKMTWAKTQAIGPLCSRHLQAAFPRVVQKPTFCRNTGDIGEC